MTKDEAIALANTKWWKTANAWEIASFQLHEDKLCCDFSVFHKAMEDVLGRPVWTHEFAYQDRLAAEMDGDKPRATFQEIMELIPEEKRVMIIETTGGSS